jgi:hypothetical protein
VLNVLKIPGALSVNRSMLTQLTPLLPRLALHVPLFAYGTTPSDCTRNLQEIAALATQFEEIVGITSA